MARCRYQVHREGVRTRTTFRGRHVHTHTHTPTHSPARVCRIFFLCSAAFDANTFLVKRPFPVPGLGLPDSCRFHLLLRVMTTTCASPSLSLPSQAILLKSSFVIRDPNTSRPGRCSCVYRFTYFTHLSLLLLLPTYVSMPCNVSKTSERKKYERRYGTKMVSRGGGKGSLSLSRLYLG